VDDVQASGELEEFVTTTQCRVAVIAACFDWQILYCRKIPSQQPCDNCQPGGKLHRFALAAVTACQASGTKKRVASPTPFEELLWDSATSSLKPEDYAYALEQAEMENQRKKPRLDPSPSLDSSPFHSSIFRPSPSPEPLGRMEARPPYSNYPRPGHEYQRKTQRQLMHPPPVHSAPRPRP
jgi:hypothetical protein